VIRLEPSGRSRRSGRKTGSVDRVNATGQP